MFDFLVFLDIFWNMSYKVVFRNGENGKNGELLINADKIRQNPTAGIMEFIDDTGIQVAVIPTDRILYVKKAESD